MATISSKGRYKYTGVYNSADGLVYGPWIAPAELDTQSNVDGTTYIVSETDVGFLDRVATALYGAGNEMLWWAMCRPNGIIDPEIDVYPGLRIYVPSTKRAIGYVTGA